MTTTKTTNSRTRSTTSKAKATPKVAPKRAPKAAPKPEPKVAPKVHAFGRDGNPSDTRVVSATKRTFNAVGRTTFKCEGACGEVKPIQSFITKNHTPLRYVECRKCRDTRVAAEKAARAEVTEAA